MVQPYGFAGGNDLFLRYIRFGVDDVFLDSPFKNPGVLQHHSEQVMDIFTGQMPDCCVVNTDFASLCLIKSHEQIDQRSLSRPRGADDGDFLTGLYRCGKIMNDRFAFVITETNMLKFHITGHAGQLERLFALVPQFSFP